MPLRASAVLGFFPSCCSWPCSLSLPLLVVFPQLRCCGMGRLWCGCLQFPLCAGGEDNPAREGLWQCSTGMVKSWLEDFGR